MSFPSWLRSRLSNRSTPCRTSSGRPNGFRPRLESLDDRLVPTTLFVKNNLDSGADSFRADIAVAKSGDTIDLSNLGGQTIALTSGELVINKSLTIQGVAGGKVTVSGSNASRVFEVDGKKTEVTLSGLVITQGYDVAGAVDGGRGGGVLNFGKLTIRDCDLNYNSANLSGAAVFNAGTLTVSGSTLDFNTARGAGGIGSIGTLTVTNCTLDYNQGGAISSSVTATISGCLIRHNSAEYGGAIYGGNLSISNCTLSDNSAVYYGGAVFAAGTVTISGCTLSGNIAYTDGGGVYVDGYVRSKVTVSNSVFSSNSPEAIIGKFTNGGGNTFH